MKWSPRIFWLFPCLFVGSAAVAGWFGDGSDRELKRVSRFLKSVLEKGEVPKEARERAAARGLLDPTTGFAADYAEWVAYYRKYLLQNDAFQEVTPLPLLASLRNEPLDIPWQMDRWARGLAAHAPGAAGACRQAVELAGGLPAVWREPNGSPRAAPPAPRVRCPEGTSPELASFVRVFTEAAATIDQEALGTVPFESRALMSFVAPWICRVRKPFVNRSKGAPPYYFHWIFEPGDPFRPGDTVTSLGLVPIPPAFSSEEAVHTYLRALVGRPAPPEPGTNAPVWTCGPVDMGAMQRGLLHLAAAFESRPLRSLREGLVSGAVTSQTVAGVEGPLLAVVETPHGRILVGGVDRNVYRDVEAAVILDVGGDDDYLFAHPDRSIGKYPLTVIVDFEGDDLYRTEGVGGPGAGVLGVGVLVDCRGNDRYGQGLAPGFDPRHQSRSTLVQKDPEGQDTRLVPPLLLYGDPERPDEPGVMLDGGFAFGAGFLGIGVVADGAGDDVYAGHRYVHGAGMWNGVGLLRDDAGHDVYVAGVASIGAGINGAFGMLDDRAGDDHYQCLGFHESGYSVGKDWDNGFDASGIGYGSSWRAENRGDRKPQPTWGGGIGVVLDGGGDDTYTGSSLSIAAGYAGGMGAVIDQGGNDTYFVKRGPDGANRSSWSGNHALANGCHRGIGYLLDRGGNDRYSASMLGGGCGWDLGVGTLLDLGGDDAMVDLHGKNEGGNTGWAATSSLAVSLHVGGTDTYRRASYGEAAPLNEGYPMAGGDFGFFIDIGRETDSYPDVPPGKAKYGNDRVLVEQEGMRKGPDGREQPEGLGLFVDRDGW